ncbi:MAG TPA: dienelactone hydrolase family protein [Bryobacteraceae bacterium]|nr:dienelactone hydrolase family protein [Bryobacteraceae bacterium]
MTVRIPSSDGGEFSAYMALPRKGRGPGVVVLQEIFGVNESMRKICDWLASRQFTALAPDLFWRTDPGAELSESEGEKARAIRAKTDDNKASDDAAAAIEFLRKNTACTGKVGVVGYCWGGLLSYLTAVRYKPDVAVGYYGVGIDKRLELAKNLSCPLLLHYAEQDQFAGPEAAKKVRETFKGDSRVIVREYPKAGHAFARPGGSHFVAAAADLADMRTLSFLVPPLFGFVAPAAARQ